MQQRGSKYDNKFKEEALALVASGVSITNAACRLRIPKSTLADWVHTQNEGDEDGVAARREIRRAQIKRCNKVVDDVVKSLGRKAAATLSEMKDLDEGLKILRKAAADGSVALEPAQVELLGKIMTNYTGTTLRELSGTLRDVMERQEALEAHLNEGESTVGTRLSIDHLSATPVGMKVWAESEVTAVDGRKVCLNVAAYDEAGLIGKGTHERFIIAKDRFLAKAQAKKGD